MFSYLENNNTSYYTNILMLEILTREDGGEPKWVDIKTLRTMNRRTKKISSPLPLKDLEGFQGWYNLYSKKCTKRASMNWWAKKISPDLVDKIIQHTKLYVDSTEKKFRLDPIRYLKREK